MPRRYRRRRKSRKKKSVARKALSLARRAYMSTDHELNFQDVTDTDFVPQPDAAAATTFNLISQGATVSQRIGERIRLKYLVGKLYLSMNQNNPLFSTAVRVLIVWDKQAVSAFTTIQNVLEQPAMNTPAESILSAYNAQQRKRIDVLYDKTVVLSQGAVGTKVVRVRIPLRNRISQYSGGGAGVGQIMSGQLSMFVIGDVATGGNQSSANAYFRLWWTG